MGFRIPYISTVARQSTPDMQPNRNLLQNSAMAVHQRGTSTASITTLNYYAADRWAFGGGTLGTWTQSVESDGPTGTGLTKSSKVLCTTADASPAAGDFLLFEQRIEGANLQRVAKGTSSAQQLTLSFWVKSNVTGTYIVELDDSDNTRSVSASYTISASATWERKTITFPADTTGAFTNDNNGSLRVIYWLGAGTTYTSGTLNTAWGAVTNANRAVGQTNLAASTNNYWQITGVQLEVGPVATPFEFKSYGQELAECQRYYFRVFPGATDRQFCEAYISSATVARGAVFFPVTMRAVPVIDQSGTANHYAVGAAAGQTVCSAVPSLSTVSTTSLGGVIFTVASGLTSGQGGRLMTDATNGANAYLGFSADL